MKLLFLVGLCVAVMQANSMCTFNRGTPCVVIKCGEPNGYCHHQYMTGGAMEGQGECCLEGEMAVNEGGASTGGAMGNIGGGIENTGSYACITRIGSGMGSMGSSMGSMGSGMSSMGSGMSSMGSGMGSMGSGMGSMGSGMGSVSTGMGSMSTGMGSMGAGMGTGTAVVGGGLGYVEDSMVCFKEGSGMKMQHCPAGMGAGYTAQKFTCQCQ